MTGLLGLVPVAELLAELTGSRRGASVLAARILGEGTAGLPRHQSDTRDAARHQLAVTGVTSQAGAPAPARAAELVAVCEILAASTIPDPPPSPDPRLVLSAPPGTVPIADNERLDGLVLDVIRRATTSLDIGGAFWNESGFEMLDEVLAPALTVRSVPTTIYVNTPAPGYIPPLAERLRTLQDLGPVAVRWFVGPRPTMLHAKFVIRDRSHGYLGTANLTSWGLQNHIEAGVELTAGQSARFVQFIEQLDLAGLFDDQPR